jgi:16S rRNA (guanine1207-N2)-methyltransferase
LTGIEGIGVDSSALKLSPLDTELRTWEVAAAFPAKRILCVTLGRGQPAAQRISTDAELKIDCWFIDQYPCRRAIEYHAEHTDPKESARLKFYCAADPDTESVQLAILPLLMHGEAELSRDILQLMYQRLTLGGRLVASVDNVRDRWLHEQMRELFPKVTVHAFDDAIVYSAVKQAELKRVRNFQCEFVFRDREKLIQAISRPGVFSHRHIDPGARQLLDAIEMGPKTRVIDIGCGAGTVSLALAARDATAQVHAVDGNARAVQCTQLGATRNQLTNVVVELNCQGTKASKGSFDLAVANPPYFADFRIAEHFIQVAQDALKPGGQLLLVTKQPQWYEDYLPDRWADVDIWPSKRYHLVAAIRA